MAWFESLQNFVETKLKLGNVTINLLNINSNNTTVGVKGEVEEESGKLTIYPHNLSPAEKQEIQGILKQAEQEEELIFDEEKSGTLINAVEYEDSGENEQLKAFFEGLIPRADYRALEEALFLRSEWVAKRGVAGLKVEISAKYGARGRNIANLCSSYYFEALVDVYNEHGKKVFDEIYELLVGQELYALFVHTGMSTDEVEKEIEKKLISCKKYSIGQLRVHGIGKKNIKKIQTAIKNVKKRGEVSFLDKHSLENEVITVVLIL